MHPLKFFILNFLHFGLKELRACVFAGSFFAILFVSRYLNLPIPRYDFLLIAAIILQILMLVFRLETPKELLAITMFHAIGLMLELYKTHPAVLSWSYPEFAYTKLCTVPLYSGFMYAAVGSYIMQAWRLFDLRITPQVGKKTSVLLCFLIYLNFFTHHYIYDFRWVLCAVIVLVYRKTFVHFTPHEREFRMPLVLAFCLIGFFIWIAENLATFFGAWQYPNQAAQWSVVSYGKISSWVLLVIISFIIVAVFKQKEKSE